MRVSSFHNPAPHLITAVILMIAVLFAQWMGLDHRIKHAVWPDSVASIGQIDSDDSNAYHSCIAFDAAALADSISLNPYLAPLLTGTQVLALWAAFASWDAPFSIYFSSRAPPQP